uniref:Sulfotransferase domain-containing protein n=1 Tax=Magallana gigas TaxID=29159 RepID=A0A8W8NP77_MAGGI
MYEFQIPENLQTLEPPRVFNTHARPNNLPEQFFEKRCKTVFVQRNPKDIAVSFYYHYKDLIKFGGTFKQFMDFFLKEDEPASETNLSEDDIIRIHDNHGNTIELLGSGGQYLSASNVRSGRYPNPVTNIPRLRKMNVNEDDIFLCAYPKAGTHWTWEIMTMLLQQSAEYHPHEKESYMYELQIPETLQALEPPRVFNTHVRPNNLPEQFFEKRCKTVFVQRNPKDISVSFYYHCKNMIQFSGTFEQFMDFFLKEDEPVLHCAWYKYTLEWEQFIRENPDHPVHCIMYEQLQQNAVEEIKRLATFLKTPCDDKLANLIAEKCSFQNLKNATLKVKKGEMSKILFRKGMVGDWKTHFTVALNEKFDQYLQRHPTTSMNTYDI